MMNSAKPEVSVRPATIDDLPAIRDIYNYYIETSTCTFDLEQKTEQELVQWFSQRSDAHPVIVAELYGRCRRMGGAVTVEVAYGLRAFGRRLGIRATQVSPKGNRSAILIDLIDRARDLGHHTIVGGTCTEHAASLAFQEALGFRHVGCLKAVGYKFGRWLDVAYTQLIL